MTARPTKPPTHWRVLALAVLLALPAPARADEAESETLATLQEAYVLREAGDFGKAAKRLRALEKTELAADAGLLRARLLLSDGDPEAAAEAAEAAIALDPPAEIRAHLYAELARSHFERGDLARAELAQSSAWDATRSGDYAAELMVALARAYEQAAQPAKAFEWYGRAWRTWPIAPASVEAYARTQALGPTLGAPEPDVNALIARAERLREVYRCDTALPIYDSVLARADATAAEKASLARSRADCLFAGRRYLEAIEAYRQLAAGKQGDPDVQILIGRSLMRSGQQKDAIAAFEKLTRSKDPLLRARARSFLAIVVEDDEPERALALLRKVEKQSADPALVVQARWSLAWADLRKRKDEAALRRLDLLADGPTSDIEIQRARYWRGVLRARSAKPPTKEAGEVQLRALAADVPLSYYGLLAAEKVGAPGLEKSFLGPRLAAPEPAPLRRARVLLDAGFPEIAQDELVSFSEDTRVAREQRIALARLFYRTGDPHRAQQLIRNGFGTALERGIDPLWRDAWELAWPRAFRQAVADANQEFHFDPPLVYAVMREESEYRPSVSSPAGALGLMQLIPPTATRVAAKLGVVGFEPSQLFDPATNIRFGTWYLRSLVERFGGSRTLAIASYNAGPEAVMRWIDFAGTEPPDVFVDAVPYGETRRYLRRVLRSYHLYRLLYPEPAAEPAAPEPSPQSEVTPSR
ncbi:MAG: transglycosylase SLT domain-containing protein [Myxococcota bacterium]